MNGQDTGWEGSRGPDQNMYMAGRLSMQMGWTGGPYSLTKIRFPNLTWQWYHAGCNKERIFQIASQGSKHMGIALVACYEL